MNNFLVYFTIGMFASNLPWLGVGMLFGFPAYLTTAIVLSLHKRVDIYDVVGASSLITFVIYSLMNGIQLGFNITMFAIPCVLSAAGLVLYFKNSLTNTNKSSML